MAQMPLFPPQKALKHTPPHQDPELSPPKAPPPAEPAEPGPSVDREAGQAGQAFLTWRPLHAHP